MESAFQWHPTAHESLKASWALLFGAQDALNGLQSEYIFNYPVNQASLEWTENFAQGILLRSRLGVTERYQQTPYPVWDLSIAREAGRIHPFLQMANLSNTGYEVIAGVRMPGRSFTGGVELVLAKRRQ